MSERRSVLIVDDDEGIRTLLSTYFGQRGFTCFLADDGVAGLAAARRLAPDVIILDLMMPRMTGLEFLRQLRREGHSLPVILLTAAANPDTVAEALRVGAQDSVAKPFSLPVLLTRVQQVLAPPPPPTTDVDVDALDVVEVSDAVAAPAARPIALPRLPTVRRFGDVPPSSPEAHTDPPAPTREHGPEAAAPTFMEKLRSLTKRIMPEQPSLQAGDVLDRRYRLDRRLGQGNFGAVWLARHLELDLDVAVKVLHKDAKPVRARETALESFRHEAMLLSRVQSRHCVRPLDFAVTAEGHAFLVMEHLVGESLRELLAREGPPSVPVACGTIADVCDALASAHKHGVAHRDVKAHNIFLAKGDDDARRAAVKLIDFGAAAPIDSIADDGVLVGTPTHMAPERFVEPTVGGPADIYACGVVLFHLLTGALPFAGENVEAIARLHASASPPAPSSVRPDARAADAVVADLLTKSALARPTAQEAAAALRSVARAKPGSHS